MPARVSFFSFLLEGNSVAILMEPPCFTAFTSGEPHLEIGHKRRNAQHKVGNQGDKKEEKRKFYNTL
jgi:hypothetical protein